MLDHQTHKDLFGIHSFIYSIKVLDIVLGGGG